MPTKHPRTASVALNAPAQQPTSPHGGNCACHLCRFVGCVLCEPEARHLQWVGLPAFSKHVKDTHPRAWGQWYQDESITGKPRRAQTRTQAREKMRARATTALREARVLEEMAHADESGVRTIPVEMLSDVQRSQITAWVSAVKRLPGLRERLFLEGIERTKNTWPTPDAYRRALKGLQAIVEEASASKKPAVVSVESSFDPRVAIEVTKLGYALGRGWDFTVHLLCLYGFRAVVDGLRRDGIIPPSRVPRVPSPGAILNADEKRMEFLSRHLRLNEDPNLAAYGMPSDEDYILDDDIGEDERDEEHRAEAVS